jgi:hypothetical protein
MAVKAATNLLAMLRGERAPDCLNPSSGVLHLVQDVANDTEQHYHEYVEALQVQGIGAYYGQHRDDGHQEDRRNLQDAAHRLGQQHAHYPEGYDCHQDQGGYVEDEPRAVHHDHGTRPDIVYHESAEQHGRWRASRDCKGKQGYGSATDGRIVGYLRGNDGLVALPGAPLLLVLAGLLGVVVAYPGGHILADPGQSAYAHAYQSGAYDDRICF